MFDFFYSDPHFGHTKIIEYSGRPFSSVYAMNDGLVARYNSLVGPDDLVLWLGDCFFLSVKAATDLLGRLNGRKVLVRGNHDRGRESMLQMGFTEVHDSLRFELGGVRFNACHFPYLQPDAKDQRFASRRPVREDGVVLVHGHSHSPLRAGAGSVHVGVDAWGFYPVPADAVVHLARSVSLDTV